MNAARLGDESSPRRTAALTRRAKLATSSSRSRARWIRSSPDVVSTTGSVGCACGSNVTSSMPGSTWWMRSWRAPASMVSVTTASSRSRFGMRVSRSQSAGNNPNGSKAASVTVSTTCRYGREAGVVAIRSRRSCSSDPCSVIWRSNSRNAVARKRVWTTSRSAPRSVEAPGSRRERARRSKSATLFLRSRSWS